MIHLATDFFMSKNANKVAKSEEWPSRSDALVRYDGKKTFGLPQLETFEFDAIADVTRWSKMQWVSVMKSVEDGSQGKRSIA